MLSHTFLVTTVVLATITSMIHAVDYSASLPKTRLESVEALISMIYEPPNQTKTLEIFFRGIANVKGNTNNLCKRPFKPDSLLGYTRDLLCAPEPTDSVQGNTRERHLALLLLYVHLAAQPSTGQVDYHILSDPSANPISASTAYYRGPPGKVQQGTDFLTLRAMQYVWAEKPEWLGLLYSVKERDPIHRFFSIHLLLALTPEEKVALQKMEETAKIIQLGFEDSGAFVDFATHIAREIRSRRSLVRPKEIQLYVDAYEYLPNERFSEGSLRFRDWDYMLTLEEPRKLYEMDKKEVLSLLAYSLITTMANFASPWLKDLRNELCRDYGERKRCEEVLNLMVAASAHLRMAREAVVAGPFDWNRQKEAWMEEEAPFLRQHDFTNESEGMASTVRGIYRVFYILRNAHLKGEAQVEEELMSRWIMSVHGNIARLCERMAQRESPPSPKKCTSLNAMLQTWMRTIPTYHYGGAAPKKDNSKKDTSEERHWVAGSVNYIFRIDIRRMCWDIQLLLLVWGRGKPFFKALSTSLKTSRRLEGEDDEVYEARRAQQERDEWNKNVALAGMRIKK